MSKKRIWTVSIKHDRGYTSSVGALDAAEAARNAVAIFDYGGEGVGFDIAVGGESVTVEVESDDGRERQAFTVTGESDPQYTVTPVVKTTEGLTT